MAVIDIFILIIVILLLVTEVVVRLIFAMYPGSPIALDGATKASCRNFTSVTGPFLN